MTEQVERILYSMWQWLISVLKEELRRTSLCRRTGAETHQDQIIQNAGEAELKSESCIAERLGLVTE